MKRIYLCGLMVFLTLMFFCWGEPAAAAWQRLTGDEVFLRKGDTIDGDLWVIGRVVTIEGNIKGDLLILAEELELSGEVDGDLLGMIGKTTVTGTINGDFRSLAAMTRIDGQIRGNVSIGGTELVLGPQGKAASLLAWSTRAQLLGTVAGSAQVTGEYFYLNGQLDGNLHVNAGQIILGDKALVTGDLATPAGNQPSIKPGAKIGGQRHEIPSVQAPILTGVKGIWFVGCLFLGLVWLLFFPRRWNRLLAVRIQWRRVIALGVGGSFLLPFFSILAGLTLIGLPLGIGLSLLFLILLLFGELPAYLLAGRWFYGLFRKQGRVHPALLFLAGGFILTFLKLLPVVGFFFTIVGRVVGNGLFLTYLFWTEQPSQQATLEA